MSSPVRVFLGSSGENRRAADEIAACLRTEGADLVLPWSDATAFPRGRTYIESLESIIKRCNSALLVATSDDKTDKRGDTDLQPRDNIILEYGMFMAAFGRERTALAVIGNPRLPTDVQNVNHVVLPDASDLTKFRESIKIPIREWMEQLKRATQELTLHTDLPNFYKRLVAILKRLGEANPQQRHQVDLAASELIESVAESFDSYPHMGDLAAFMEQEHLRECNGIFAVDVLGPYAWISPKAYRYLASQARHYLRQNSVGSPWTLAVSEPLKSAIDHAINQALSATQGGKQILNQSLTNFDNPKELRVEVGRPKLEYARLLLWSKEELLGQVADTVITIHDQFSVPLFFIETAPDDPKRDLDFLAIRKERGDVTGKMNIRRAYRSPYQLHNLERGVVPGHGNALDFYWTLLQDERLMFAKDAKLLHSL